MKKTGVILILALMFIFPLVLKLAIAQEVAAPGIPGVDPNILDKDPGQVLEDFKNSSQTKGEYLKQEWRTILTSDKYAGPVFNAIDGFFNFLNPFFKMVLGVEYSLSWAFIFAIVIWIVLFAFLYQPAKAILGDKTLFGLVGAFIIASLVGLAGVIKRAVDLLDTVITQTWLIYVALGLTLLIGFIIIKLGGGLKQTIEKGREKEAKEKEKHDREILHTDAEVSEKKLKSYED